MQCSNMKLFILLVGMVVLQETKGIKDWSAGRLLEKQLKVNGPKCPTKFASNIEETTLRTCLEKHIRSGQKNNDCLGPPDLAEVQKTLAVFVSPCCLQHLNKDSLDEQETTEDNNEVWKPVNSQSAETFTFHLPSCTSTPSIEALQRLPQFLHDLADSLPRLGAFVDVLWVTNKEDQLAVDEHLELYGALTRLIEWNNAHVKMIMAEEGVDDDVLKDWSSGLRTEVMLLRDLGKHDPRTLWRGDIHVYGIQSSKPVRFPGFCLCDNPVKRLFEGLEEPQVCKDRILSNNLTFLSHVTMSTVPTFLMSNVAYRLKLSSKSCNLPKSQQFLQVLHKNRETAYLMRLDYGYSWRNNDDTDKSSKSKINADNMNWTQYIIQNVDYALDCPMTARFLGNTGSYKFLVCAVGPADEENYMAYLFHPLSVINGGVAHTLAMRETRAGATDEECETATATVREAMTSLPHLEGSMLTHIQEHIETLQTEVLQAFIDQRKRKKMTTNVSLLEISRLLAKARHQFWQTLLKDGQLKTWKPTTPKFRIKQLKRDYGGSITQMERLILEYKSNETTANECKSNVGGTLAGLSPPQKGSVVTLNAAEFLKYFKPDGRAAKQNLSLLCFKEGRTKLCRYDSGEVRGESWPESSNYHYHDTYYNRGNPSDELEEQCCKLKARLQGIETASTCTLEQAHSPATLRVTRKPDVIDTSRRSIDRHSIPSRGASDVRRSRQVDADEMKHRRLSHGDKKRPEHTQSSSNSSRSKSGHSKEKRTDQSKDKLGLQEKKMLQDVVKEVLQMEGITKTSDIFKSCGKRLYEVVKSMVKDLVEGASPAELREDMTCIVQGHIKQIITFEKMRMERLKARQQNQLS